MNHDLVAQFKINESQCNCGYLHLEHEIPGHIPMRGMVNHYEDELLDEIDFVRLIHREITVRDCKGEGQTFSTMIPGFVRNEP